MIDADTLAVILGWCATFLVLLFIGLHAAAESEAQRMSDGYLSGTTPASDVVAPADAMRPSPVIDVSCGAFIEVDQEPRTHWPLYPHHA